MTDLWPDDIVKSPIKAPVAILREQAKFLERKTKGLVQAVIVPSAQSKESKEFNYKFDLVSPSMSGTHYRLFAVAYDIQLYPATISVEIEIATEIQSLHPDVLHYWDNQYYEAGPAGRNKTNLMSTPDIKLSAVTQGAFIDHLHNIFNSKKARRVVQNFIAQVNSYPGEETPFDNED